MARGGFLSPELPIYVAEGWEAMRYAGSTIVVDSRDIAVITPTGDIHYCTTVSAARKWARDQRKRAKGENHDHRTIPH